MINHQERKRRRRERIIILILVLLIFCLAFIESKLLNPNTHFPLANSIVLFILINLNIILLLSLVFLVLRNVVKLIAEYKRGILGSKIRAKLVVLFVGLSLFPTLILFGISIKFVFSSFNYWLNFRVERALNQAMAVGHLYYKETCNDVLRHARILAKELKKKKLAISRQWLKGKIYEYNFSFVKIYDKNKKPMWSFYQKPFKNEISFENNLDQALTKKGATSMVIRLSKSDFALTILPIFSNSNELKWILVAGRRIPSEISKELEDIGISVGDYKQFMLVQQPLKLTLLITFSIMTLLILFAATWVGFRLAKGITAPIQKLAEATQRIASGDLDFSLHTETKDELGMLVKSFNQMTRDLKTSKEHLEGAYKILKERNLEIEQRRRYMETILRNIATGVISIDAHGCITTINPAAKQILKLNKEDLIGKRMEEIFMSYGLKEIVGVLQLLKKGNELIEKQLRFSLNGQNLTLLVSASSLKDELGNHLGAVFVFEDLTQMEKIQRIAAWREVARRIAHEIKNPLTPIQLSAQRLRRRYLEKFSEDGQIFDECTQMIIREVDELRQLVSEFSKFARMPEANLTPNNLAEIVSETLAVYRSANQNIQFEFKQIRQVPIFNLDREQIKRALINLLDNAVASIEGEGKVEIVLDHEPRLKIARLEVRDTGRGIPDEDKRRLFEPYFSTKKSGTGLGLTIVHTIISDHQGFIRVKDNYPKGTVFTIELPTNI